MCANRVSSSPPLSFLPIDPSCTCAYFSAFRMEYELIFGFLPRRTSCATSRKLKAMMVILYCFPVAMNRGESEAGKLNGESVHSHNRLPRNIIFLNPCVQTTHHTIIYTALWKNLEPMICLFYMHGNKMCNFLSPKECKEGERQLQSVENLMQDAWNCRGKSPAPSINYQDQNCKSLVGIPRRRCAFAKSLTLSDHLNAIN